MDPTTSLLDALTQNKSFVQDLNHKQTLEAVKLGRRQFNGVPDAQHWIAGLGFVPVISNSPLDVLSGAYDYAGVIWGQDGGDPVSAAVFPVKSLPLDDIKAHRATIYLGQSMLNKAGTSEGAKDGWETRRKHLGKAAAVAQELVSNHGLDLGKIKANDASGSVFDVLRQFKNNWKTGVSAHTALLDHVNNAAQSAGSSAMGDKLRLLHGHLSDAFPDDALSKAKKSLASEQTLRDMLDDLMGKSKAGEKEGHEFRGNQYKKKPVSPKASATKPGKASASKPGAGKKIAKKVVPTKKTPPKPALVAVKKPAPESLKDKLANNIKKNPPKYVTDLIESKKQAKPATLAEQPTAIEQLKQAKLVETPMPPQIIGGVGPLGYPFGEVLDVSDIKADALVLPKAKVKYDGNTYTMVGNTSGEHAKYFHLQSSAQKHAEGMNDKFPGHIHEVIPFKSMELYSVGRLVSGTPHAAPPPEPVSPKPKQDFGVGLEIPGSLGVASQGKKVVSTWTNTNINDIVSASDIPPKGEVKFKDKTFTAVPDGHGGVKVHPSIKLAASEANMLNAMGVTHKKFMPLYLKQSKQYIVGLEKDPNEKLPEKTESMLIPGTPFLAGDEEGGEVPTLGGKGVQEAFDKKQPTVTTNVDIGGLADKGTPKNPYGFHDDMSGVDLQPGMAFADEEGNVMQIVSKPGEKGAPYVFPNTEDGVTHAMSAATHMSEKYGPYFGAAPLSGDTGWAVMVMAAKFNPSAKPKVYTGTSHDQDELNKKNKKDMAEWGKQPQEGYGNAVTVPDKALETESSGTNEAADEFKDLPFSGESISNLADTVASNIGVSKVELFKALSSHADPSNSKLAKIRVQAESAILKSHTAIKDAVQHLEILDDAKEKDELLEVLTTGDVKRAQLEYAKTPLYDLQCLSKITVYDHPVQGQANCNLESRSMNMGTTSVTGDFRHELGHAIHGALGATHGKDQTNPMLVVISKHFDTVKAAMKAHPEGMGTGKGEPGTPGNKMSHQWYMENYHIIGRRGADNWLEDFAELYRGYHRAAFQDSAQKVSGLKGGNLDDFRKHFPTIARLFDARYTAAIMGRMSKTGEVE